MLSILIPTYNYNVYPLVFSLVQQLSIQNISYEVIVLDDGSQNHYRLQNEKINNFNFCKFLINKNNLGLSSTRNLLIKASKYNYVLFIDGDSVIFDSNYIKNYIQAINNNLNIIYGGRIHPKAIGHSNQKLRWKYGKYVEDKLCDVRTQSPYKTLMFNNTLIKKDLLKKIQFDSTITKYGHEDTLLAYQISLLQFKVTHINNPVEHGDIDLNTIFIAKTISGLDNLKSIYKKNLIEIDFITLLKWYDKLFRFKLHYIFILFHHLLQNVMIKNLESQFPSLLVFKLFKICHFCYTCNQEID
ncbi:glycosyltransferase family 2 protein [Aestuariibaculum suncheonense]|uniref:Glycosyltransferase family 2 protein n=1 Tax=Aestuariibaculum suncheonense TaxID=1028745 RepID=A0A8J6U9V5_9FLAO|nr:glycosyltransferase [Aestuariibaculum suncheonense]MBD0834508.1 glycosyltransferase family 2 protein [Aestuariibaculum suncheonense]